MDDDLKQAINEKLMDAVNGDLSQIEVTALKEKITAIKELSDLIGE